jgi:anti-anti-sigma regulatory factor
MLAIKGWVIRDLEVLVLLAVLRLEVVAELERVISEGSGPLWLDLSELRSADSAGFAALRALCAASASLVGASPYIKLLLGN